MKYFHYNHLGDVALATGADAQTVALKPGLENIGLRLYGQRLYDGDLGRFLMPDTIIPNLYEPQSMHPYSYCHNDPVNYIDPSGHYRRVPRIFPQGEMPSPGTNMLVGGLQVVSTIVGAAVSFGCFGNVTAGIAVAMALDIAVNAVVPAILARDRDTITRSEMLTRIGIDVLTHGLAAAGGFLTHRLTNNRRRSPTSRLVSALVVESGMLVGGLWSNQLGGLMKSFGMGYNIRMMQVRRNYQSQHAAHAVTLQTNDQVQDHDNWGSYSTLEQAGAGWSGQAWQAVRNIPQRLMGVWRRGVHTDVDIERGTGPATYLFAQGSTDDDSTSTSTSYNRSKGDR